ncbi:MAG: phosphate ABC transporter permease PstA [Chthoniobacteraceae bacterium]
MSESTITADHLGDVKEVFHGHTQRTLFRLLFNQLMSGLCILLALATFIPLGSILWLVISKGVQHLRWDTFTTLAPAPGMAGNGLGNAILGTGLLVGLAIAISAPLGILSAVYICEYGRNTWLAGAVRFTAKLLTGIPSIICGVFAYAVIVVTTEKFSALAGAIALGVLALPTILLTSEQALLGVSKSFREASFGLGATNFQTIWRIILPEAFPAMMTGIMLAVARAAGETAPVLFTALFNNFWNTNIWKPTATLSVLIYNFSTMPYPEQIALAWTASLVLVGLVTVTNIFSQLAFSKK